MRIGIDARLIEETGVGRYIRNLISHLALIDHTNEYVVFLTSKSYSSFLPPNPRWTKVIAQVPWHSFEEQIAMPGIFGAAKLDLLHVPYHNPPIFYNGRMVVTIHDLTILHFNTGKATTLPLPLYQLKRLGYWAELAVGLRKASSIIAVSETTKREIMDHFHISPEKITVTYEGVDEKISNIPISSTGEQNPQSQKVRLMKDSYFLYVGNAYPHKNLETLLEAYALYRHKKPVSKIKLVLVGNDDFFYRRLQRLVEKMKLTDSVIFFGPANDAKLANLYEHAVAFVFPSLMEGFGLPALEALAFGCPVLVSDISVFHEVLGEYGSYMNPKSVTGIAQALSDSTKVSRQQSEGVKKLISSYSWQRLAKETLSIYERSASV